MFLRLQLLFTLLLPPTILALPSSLQPRASSQCVDTCGSTCYTASDISAAQSEGYSLYQSGDTLGSDEYPHTYHDYEGFDFPVSGPYQEFPILSSHKVYSGGSPGADRVVFNEEGDLAGLITHTGASGDDFLQCTADS